MSARICSVPDCGRRTKARGWCLRHYHQLWYKNRNLAYDRSALKDDASRFAELWILDPSTGCHIWTGLRRRGYGRFHVPVRDVPAHVFAYEQKYGPVPPGMHLDHFACDNPPCVNPDHVRPVTPRENVLRGNGPTALNLAKTHCAHGHPFSAENTWFDRNGWRQCRTCNRERARRSSAARWAAKRAARVVTGLCRNGLHDTSLPDAIMLDGSGRHLCKECRRANMRRQTEARRQARLDPDAATFDECVAEALAVVNEPRRDDLAAKRARR